MFMWVIFALLDPDADPSDLIESGSNTDPDPKHCSELLRQSHPKWEREKGKNRENTWTRVLLELLLTPASSSSSSSDSSDSSVSSCCTWIMQLKIDIHVLWWYLLPTTINQDSHYYGPIGTDLYWVCQSGPWSNWQKLIYCRGPKNKS